MINEFIIAGKITDIYDTGLVTVKVKKGFAMFNTDAYDLIDVRVPENLSIFLDKLSVGIGITIKGRIQPTGCSNQIELVVERMFVYNG